jgi:release factor glutamine methyltransferase
MNQTYREALQRASFCLREAGIEQSRFEAEIMLAKLLKIDRTSLIAHQDDLIEEVTRLGYEAAIQRRVSKEPVAYITGEKYFYGRKFIVNRTVLIPRPETELLIEQALMWTKSCFKHREELNILDLGTGCGNLAINLALELPLAEVWAVDISKPALETARENAHLHKVKERIHFLESNYFSAIRGLKMPLFDLIVSNPPYISSKEMASLPRSVVDYEPHQALDGGKDGLGAFRKILGDVAGYARKPTFLLLEIGANQREEVGILFRESSIFRMIGWRRDLSNHPRLYFGLI